MFCKECGSKLADGARFCPSCGTPVSETAAGPMGEPAPEPESVYASESADEPVDAPAAAPEPARQTVHQRLMQPMRFAGLVVPAFVVVIVAVVAFGGAAIAATMFYAKVSEPASGTAAVQEQPDQTEQAAEPEQQLEAEPEKTPSQRAAELYYAKAKELQATYGEASVSQGAAGSSLLGGLCVVTTRDLNADGVDELVVAYPVDATEAGSGGARPWPENDLLSSSTAYAVEVWSYADGNIQLAASTSLVDASRDDWGAPVVELQILQAADDSGKLSVYAWAETPSRVEGSVYGLRGTVISVDETGSLAAHSFEKLGRTTGTLCYYVDGAEMGNAVTSDDQYRARFRELTGAELTLYARYSDYAVESYCLWGGGESSSEGQVGTPAEAVEAVGANIEALASAASAA